MEEISNLHEISSVNCNLVLESNTEGIENMAYECIQFNNNSKLLKEITLNDSEWRYTQIDKNSINRELITNLKLETAEVADITKLLKLSLEPLK